MKRSLFIFFISCIGVWLNTSFASTPKERQYACNVIVQYKFESKRCSGWDKIPKFGWLHTSFAKDKKPVEGIGEVNFAYDDISVRADL